MEGAGGVVFEGVRRGVEEGGGGDGAGKVGCEGGPVRGGGTVVLPGGEFGAGHERAVEEDVGRAVLAALVEATPVTRAGDVEEGVGVGGIGVGGDEFGEDIGHRILVTRPVEGEEAVVSGIEVVVVCAYHCPGETHMLVQTFGKCCERGRTRGSNWKRIAVGELRRLMRRLRW